MAQRRIVDPETALDRLESLCARSEQCSFDVMRKMATWGISRDQAEKIVMQLENGGFIDDGRYAEAYVRDKYRFARWGRNKIRLGLVAKKISRSDIDNALMAIDQAEYRTIMLQVLKAKSRSLPEDMAGTFEGKNKLIRFAAGRGYELDLILSAVSGIWD